MARAALTAAFVAVSAAITAIEFYYYFLINLQQLGAAVPGTTTTTTKSANKASASAGDEFQVLLAVATAGALHAAVALIHGQLLQAEAAGAAGNRRVPDGVGFLLLAAAGLLVLQGVPGGAVDDDVAAAIGAAAFGALPGAAAATFFLGMMTLILAVAGAGFFGEIQGPMRMRVLTKVAVGAAAVLVFLVTVAAFGIK
ncbi:unnamed protein product [Urochloa humidicola]